MALTRVRAEQILDIDFKQAVRVLQSTNVADLVTAAPSVVDSVALSLNDRILVSGQDDQAENGLYYVAYVGSGSNGEWVRTQDGNVTGEINAGMIVMVTEGYLYADTLWKLITDNPIVIGVTNLEFVLNSQATFDIINANGTPVSANTISSTINYLPGNNMVINGLDLTDSITFAVNDAPNFAGNVSTSGNLFVSRDVSITGNLTIGANLNVVNVNEYVGATGNISFLGNLLPGTSNVQNYSLGLPGQPWTDVYVANLNVAVYSIDNLEVTTDATIFGNLTVLGTTTTINSNVIVTNDLNIDLANNQSTFGNVNGAGLLVGNTGNAAVLTWQYNYVANSWTTNVGITAQGNVSGNYIYGNGAFLTDINAGNIVNAYGNANVAAYLPTYTGNITAGNISATGNITANYYSGNGVQLTGIATATDLSNTNSNVSNLTTSLGNTNSNVSNLSNSLSNTNSNVSNIVLDIANTNSNVSNTNSNVANLTTSLSNTNSNVSNLTTSLGNTNSNVSNLSNALANTNSNVTTLSNTVANNSANITTLQGNVYANANVAAYLPTYTGNITANIISATGNITGNYILGNIAFANGLPTTYGNSNVANYLPTYTGDITAANISITGLITATAELIGPDTSANLTRFPYAQVVVSSVAANIQKNEGGPIGLIAEGVGNSADTSHRGVGVYGVGYTSGAASADGVTGEGHVSASGDTGTAVGVRGYADDVHAGGINIGLYGTAINAATNYALYMKHGNILSFDSQDWTLVANTASALSIESVAKAGILNVDTTVGTERVTMSGNLSVVGNVTSAYILGNGSQLTGISSTTDLANTNSNVSNLSNSLSNTNSNVSNTNSNVANLTTALSNTNSNVSNIASNVTLLQGQVYANANVAAYLPTYTGNITAGNISLTGNITANVFIGNGSQLTGIVTNYSNANVAAYLASNSNVVISTTNDITTTAVLTGASLAVGDINSIGVITGTDIIASNNAGGNGSVTATGNITAGGWLISGNSISAAGTLSIANGNLFVNGLGNVQAGNLLTNGRVSAQGNVTGAYILGNGSQLTDLPVQSGTYSNANVAAYLPTYSGNITAGNVSITGNITGNYIFGNGSQLTGLPATYGNTEVAAYLPTYTGNLAGNNLSVTTTANVGTLYASSGISVTGTMVATYANAQFVNQTNGAGWFSAAGNIYGANSVSVVGNIAGNVFIGNGSQLTGISVPSVAGTAATVTTNAQPNITSVGTLTTLTVTGNTQSGNLLTAGYVSSTGNISSGNLSVTGNLAVTYTAANVGSGLQISAANTEGGVGYADFLRVTNTSAGATNPNKSLRLNSTGSIEIINSAYTATLFTLTDTGNLAVPGTMSASNLNGPTFRAYVSVAQTITSGSQQKVTFGSETFDTNNNFASSTFTPTVSGYYQFNATVRLDGSSSTGECMIILYKNGTEYARGTNESGTEQGANFWSMQVSDVAFANGTTDTFEIYIQQVSGGSRNTTAGQSISYFSGVMVRGA